MPVGVLSGTFLRKRGNVKEDKAAREIQSPLVGARVLSSEGRTVRTRNGIHSASGVQTRNQNPREQPAEASVVRPRRAGREELGAPTGSHVLGRYRHVSHHTWGEGPADKKLGGASAPESVCARGEGVRTSHLCTKGDFPLHGSAGTAQCHRAPYLEPQDA